MSCDLCGKTKCDVISLNEKYITDEVGHVCDECRRDIEDKLNKIIKMLDKTRDSIFKRFLTQRYKERITAKVSNYEN